MTHPAFSGVFFVSRLEMACGEGFGDVAGELGVGELFHVFVRKIAEDYASAMHEFLFCTGEVFCFCCADEGFGDEVEKWGGRFFSAHHTFEEAYAVAHERALFACCQWGEHIKKGLDACDAPP